MINTKLCGDCTHRDVCKHTHMYTCAIGTLKKTRYGEQECLEANGNERVTTVSFENSKMVTISVDCLYRSDPAKYTREINSYLSDPVHQSHNLTPEALAEIERQLANGRVLTPIPGTVFKSSRGTSSAYPVGDPGINKKVKLERPPIQWGDSAPYISNQEPKTWSVPIPGDTVRLEIPNEERRVLGFIEQWRRHSGAVEMFTHGMCYWFAHILIERFDNDADYRYKLELFYNPLENHFRAKINDMYYDIEGCHGPDANGYIWWMDYRDTDCVHAQRIMHDCMRKGDTSYVEP